MKYWYSKGNNKIQAYPYNICGNLKQELAKLLFKPMDAQELQDPEKCQQFGLKN